MLISAVSEFAGYQGLANPHEEPQPPEHVWTRGRPAGVVIAFVEEAGELQLVLTERHHRLRYGGHVVLPGGRLDHGETALAAAQREWQEETGAPADALRVIGSMPAYATHRGDLLHACIALVDPGVRFAPNPAEVDALFKVPARNVFSPLAYQLHRRAWWPSRGNWALRHEHWRVSGPTVSLLIHLYDAVACVVERKAAERK